MLNVKRIDEVLRKGAASEDVPGVIGVAATNTGVIYEGAFGKRDITQDQPMTLDTVAWLASMTKALTAAAAMQLVEGGKIKLEQAAKELVPGLDAPQVLEGFDDAGKPRLRPARRPITVRHLLTHTAGFSYEFWSPEIQQWQTATATPQIISCENAALTTPLLFDPGERFEYGISIDWVGKIVESVSGRPIGRYLQENIFDPLGMKDTAFKITPSMRARLAPIHQRGEDGSLQATTLEIPQEPQFQMGGGGLYGTAKDYLAFTQMIMQGGTYNGNQVLRPETVSLMAQNHIGNIDVGELKSAIPSLSNDVKLYPGMKLKWGLSFLINSEQTHEGRAAGSLAWAGLANTFFWIDPKTQVTGVFLTQVLPFFDEKAATLFSDFETAVYRSL